MIFKGFVHLFEGTLNDRADPWFTRPWRAAHVI